MISSSTNKETMIPSQHVVTGESKMPFSTSPKKQNYNPPPPPPPTTTKF
jgi:hypothetical protein